VMNRIGTGLLKQSKPSQDDGKGNKSPRRKDILSLLVHANSTEAEAQRLSDEDVLSRVYQVVLDWCICLICFQRSPLS
jgi:hypothetical protein